MSALNKGRKTSRQRQKDNIFITQTKSYTIHPHCNGLSHHEAQIIVIESTVPAKHRKHILTTRDFNDLNILEFQSLLSQENWEEVFMNDDANISFNKFHNTYIRIFHSCFVKKHKNLSTISKPWITRGIEISCDQKRELYLRTRDTKEIKCKVHYKQYCKILTEVIKEAKRFYYKKVITKSKNKMKTTWNIIQKETSNPPKVNNIKSLRINNHTVYNQLSIANELNNIFLNTARSISNKGINGTEGNTCPLQNFFEYYKQPFKNISWSYTSAKEVNKIIDSLKNKNSSGYDEIPTKIIKAGKPFIISPLINICNKMLAQGIYPERLKFSLVKPIYKSGDKSSPTNYRPISLLPTFSKIFKKVIYKRLMDHLNSNVIQSQQQYGFRSEMSTDNASHVLLNEILTAVNNKEMVGGIFCDLHGLGSSTA